MASEEVMVAQSQGIGQKITEVAILLQTQKQVTITAINLAIPTAINLAEFIKHRVKGLHQLNSFERVQDSMKTRLKIILSFTPLDNTSKGYQAPIPDSEVTEKTLEELKKPPQRVFRDNAEDPRGVEHGERRGRSGRRGRRPRWGPSGGSGEEGERGRGRRPRRPWGEGPSRRVNEERRDDEFGGRRPRRARGERGDRQGGFAESRYGRSERGRRPRRPRGPRNFDRVPDWGAN